MNDLTAKGSFDESVTWVAEDKAAKLIAACIKADDLNSTEGASRPERLLAAGPDGDIA